MSFSIDPELARKYSQPGPRYTSYPTAPQFTTEHGAEAWATCLEEASKAPVDEPLSLYFHVPFCDKLCWFCACTVVISNRQTSIDDYCEHLVREVEDVARRIAPRRRVTQVHFGGGSPSHAGPDNLRRIMRTVRTCFDVDADAEISIEVDPPDVTAEVADAIAECGFGRVSMGIQEFDSAVQEAINRVQSPELTGDVIRMLRERGISGINTDIIYGLPLQTLEGLSRTLDSLRDLAPDRVACFGYAHVPWLKSHQKLIREEDLPSPGDRLAMLVAVVEALGRDGYVFIGLDHFARPGDSLLEALDGGSIQRNFQGYSTHGGADLLAFGISGIGQVAGNYFQNTKNVLAYKQAIAAGGSAVERGIMLSPEDRLRHDVIMGLMCRFGLDTAQLGAQHGVDFDTHFAAELAALEPLAVDGLVKLEAGAIRVPQAGRMFVRNVAMAFDGYLGQEAGATEPRYSRTV